MDGRGQTFIFDPKLEEKLKLGGCLNTSTDRWTSAGFLLGLFVSLYTRYRFLGDTWNGILLV